MPSRHTATHDLIEFPNGSFSLRELASGESMHSRTGPLDEARTLYVGQSGLREKLMYADHPAPLVVYDIGMGIGANALAALDCALSLDPPRRLHLVSFENDLSGVRLAIEKEEFFPFLKSHLPALKTLLAQGRWQCPQATWELRKGPFETQDLSALESPELIYFDFYSPKTCPQLWEMRIFEALHRKCGPSSELYTYSSSTSARSAMMLAGFFCGAGVATSTKGETTVATNRLESLKSPLGRRWFDKFMRSTKPLPSDWEMDRFEEARKKLLTSAQFREIDLSTI